MFSSNSWSALSKELYKRFSSGADVIFFDMGRSYGSELAASLISRAEVEHVKPDPHSFDYLVTKAGWGRVTLDGELDHGSHLSIVVTSMCFLRGR